MDTITHALLGAVVAQLGFRQRIGRDATWVAALAAIAADLDILAVPILSRLGVESAFWGPMAWHRGFTHSLIASAVIALVIAVVWRLVRGRTLPAQVNTAPAPKPDKTTHPEIAAKLAPQAKPEPAPRRAGLVLLFLCALAGAASNCLLKAVTVSGAQLLAPFDTTRFALCAVAMIDVFFTGVLILTLLACFAVRSQRAGRAPIGSAVIGAIGLLLAVGYLLTGRFLHDRAIELARTSRPDDKIVRVDAYPSAGSIFLWRAVIETKEGWRATQIHHFSKAPPADWPTNYISKAPNNSWKKFVLRLPEVKKYQQFTDGRMRIEYSKSGSEHQFVFHDMRFGIGITGVKSVWPIAVHFNSSGAVSLVALSDAAPITDMFTYLSEMWGAIWGSRPASSTESQQGEALE